jgi:hypothetical protein
LEAINTSTGERMGKSQYTLAKQIGRTLPADLTFEQVRDKIDMVYAGELDALKLDFATDTAIRARNAAQRTTQQELADEQEGFEAFPSGRFADALRGTKSFPDHVRCPYKRPDRVAAWKRGYKRAHEAALESFAKDR